MLFYFLLAFTAFVWCLVSLVFAPFMAFRARYRFVVQNWCRCAIWLGKTLVGLRYEVHGAENVPARPCVIWPSTRAPGRPSFFRPTSSR